MTNPFTRLGLARKGRIGRRRFWALGALLWGGFAVLYVFLENTLGRGATLVLYPPFFIAMAALMALRFHDRDKSGWWSLLVALPVLGPLWLFWQLALRAGTNGANRFGPDPRQAGRDYLTVA
ncbi:MAG: DUF805 domain-containing protein [Alphaproteobacteria bacterium]|nr:MAG: DUF805 domain-containing protein [Alphaproteobacteria bacterium]